MKKLIYYTLLLLSFSLYTCCSSNNNQSEPQLSHLDVDDDTLPSLNTTSTTQLPPSVSSVESTVEASHLIEDYFPGDLNHDGIPDKVERIDKGDTMCLSVWFGKDDDEYSLFKEWKSTYLMIPFIEGDSLRLSPEQGESYNFKFKNNNFYWIGYDLLDYCCPKFRLDFINKKMIFVIDGFDGVREINDEFKEYYFPLPIPLEKMPTSLTIDDCFQQEFRLEKYTQFDTAYLSAKVDSFVKIINDALPEQDESSFIP